MMGGKSYAMALIDRIEASGGSGEDTYVWDAQGWYGTDWNKLWIKTEAEGKQGESPESDELQDHHLETREQTDAFQQKHNVDTTPQTWIDGEGIGGYEALREYFGAEAKDEDATSYKPVIAIFAISLLMGLAISWAAYETVLTVRAVDQRKL